MIELREVPEPIPGPEDAVVRVLACGICGSDLHWFSGGAPPPSVCPGHEMVGQVASAPRTSAVREGDRVAVEPLRPCLNCAECRRGEYNVCPRLHILGVHEDGGLADLVRVPAGALYKLPDGLALSDAVLTEPLAVAVHALRLAPLQPDQRVLVLGSGSIGLLTIVAALHLGAGEVWATARHPHQAALARRLGACRVFDTEREGRRALRDAASKNAVHVVAETVGGAASTLRQGVNAVAPGGTVLLLGLFDGDPPFPAIGVLIKEVRVVGSIVYNRRAGESDFERSIAILHSDSARLRELITHRFDLSEIQNAFETASDKTTGAVKVVLEPSA